MSLEPVIDRCCEAQSHADLQQRKQLRPGLNRRRFSEARQPLKH
jgi:hypothetical protein